MKLFPLTPARCRVLTKAELFSDITFGTASAVHVSAGTYDLRFTTEDCPGTGTVFTTPALAVGQRYLVVAAGELIPEGQPDDPAGSDFTVIPVTEEGLDYEGVNSYLKVVHAGVAPTVDVGVVNGAGILVGSPAIQDLEFGDAVVWDVGSAALNFGIAAADTTNSLLDYSLSLTEKPKAFVVVAGDVSPEGSEQALDDLYIVEGDRSSLTAWEAVALEPN